MPDPVYPETARVWEEALVVLAPNPPLPPPPEDLDAFFGFFANKTMRVGLSSDEALLVVLGVGSEKARDGVVFSESCIMNNENVAVANTEYMTDWD